jgi:uncharacterized membrane protein
MLHEDSRAPIIAALSSIVGLVGVVAITLTLADLLILSVAIQRSNCQLTTLCSWITFICALQHKSWLGRF